MTFDIICIYLVQYPQRGTMRWYVISTRRVKTECEQGLAAETASAYRAKLSIMLKPDETDNAPEQR